MRGVASIRTETHLRRFLHGIRLFCNAHSPPKSLSHQNLFLSQKRDPIFQSPLLPLAIRSAAPAMCSPLRRLRAYAYATRPIAVGNTGSPSPYFAALNTGSCYAIAPRGGQYAPPLRLCARATPLRAYAYATRPIAIGNTGFCRPISLRSIRAFVALLPLAIRAFVALFRCAQ